MKKIIFLFASLIAVLAFSSCTKKRSVAVTVDNFLEVAKEDFATESQKSDAAVFYESQITFTDNITAEGTVRIERVMNVIQDTSMCIQFYHQKNSTFVTRTQTWWLEDMPVDLDHIISLDSAIKRLQMADIIKPQSRLCVLRRILGPKPTDPEYIFGSMGTGFVSVNAVTGDVNTIE